MSAWILIALCSIIPQPAAGIIDDRPDVLEINHFYDGNGKHIFDQLIAWDWDGLERRHAVQWYVIWKNRPLPVSGRVVFAQGNFIYRIKAKSWLESWTQYDPELHDRSLLPQGKRRGLRNSP